MTLCSVNYHRFHFVLYIKDCVFEELECCCAWYRVICHQSACFYIHHLLITIYQLDEDSHSAVELIDLHDMYYKIALGI